jgi:hypothetical protein
LSNRGFALGKPNGILDESQTMHEAAYHQDALLPPQGYDCREDGSASSLC